MCNMPAYLCTQPLKSMIIQCRLSKSGDLCSFFNRLQESAREKKTPPPQSTSLSHVFETSANMLKAHFTRTMGILIAAVCFGFYHNYAIICTDNTLFFSEKPCLIILSYHMLCQGDGSNSQRISWHINFVAKRQNNINDPFCNNDQLETRAQAIQST